MLRSALLSLAVLAGCGGTPDLYSVPTAAVTDRINIAYATVEVRDVSLPSYAADDVIAVEAPNGVLLTDADIRWADSPERAVGLELTRHLSQLSRARVASEPWPFEGFAEAILEVRFESFLARANGTFTAQGQYFVSTEREVRDRSGLFDLAVPYDPAGGPAAIAAARGQLVLDLAELIAKDGLR
ncbi:PqiC family protein [Pseudooctadecabacter jejudonensis]|uniref:ABC-type transport auxiliary lipoprotein component domain-containing protein n=1 Tax=Pseudooctadecabacter jejudonensis TaxID=1391910 RepID=A0A1Y5RIE4_9RHOB|nr:ABC-type transport auxiliary lipoprotein family protein [Pseudooctadecabacter jejudonensis]SLN18259.1 hypothetical protein PSJ8397_00584 [Pseudooctadecabacter jejudonensis]